MKEFTKKTITAMMLTATALASVSSFASDYQPSTANQVGRYVDHNNNNATVVNPNLYKSISVADRNLRSLERYKNHITKEMGHIIAYGNNIETFDELYGVEKIYGDFKIHDNPINNMRFCQTITHIGGSFDVYDTRIDREDMDGCLNLEYVGNNFMIGESAFPKGKEVDLRGLQGLKIVRNHFNVSGIRMKNNNLDWARNLEVVGYFNASNTGITNTYGLSGLRQAVDINLSQNPLVDLGGMEKVKIEGHIFIDKEVPNNPNFRGMKSSAWLCQEGNAKHFHPNGAKQEEVCGK